MVIFDTLYHLPVRVKLVLLFQIAFVPLLFYILENTELLSPFLENDLGYFIFVLVIVFTTRVFPSIFKNILKEFNVLLLNITSLSLTTFYLKNYFSYKNDISIYLPIILFSILYFYTTYLIIKNKFSINL